MKNTNPPSTTRVPAVTTFRVERKSTGTKCKVYKDGVLREPERSIWMRQNWPGWEIVPNSVNVITRAEAEAQQRDT